MLHSEFAEWLLLIMFAVLDGLLLCFLVSAIRDVWKRW